MTTDKEAQKEEISALISTKAGTYTSLFVHGTRSTPGEILLLMEELGYRRLPKDKPPLIIDNSLSRYANIESQRVADINHYEGGGK